MISHSTSNSLLTRKHLLLMVFAVLGLFAAVTPSFSADTPHNKISPIPKNMTREWQYEPYFPRLCSRDLTSPQERALSHAQARAKTDPSDPELQRYLAKAYECTGLDYESIEFVPDDLKHSLSLFQTLVSADPLNNDWQHDLAISYQHVGFFEMELGNFDAAKQALLNSLIITKRLASTYESQPELNERPFYNLSSIKRYLFRNESYLASIESKLEVQKLTTKAATKNSAKPHSYSDWPIESALRNQADEADCLWPKRRVKNYPVK